jgi:hypothetical protein
VGALLGRSRAGREDLPFMPGAQHGVCQLQTDEGHETANQQDGDSQKPVTAS